MKIKNVKTLRARATWHANNDHIKQGTYGIASINGHAEFKGCAIGCLSTPHTKVGLRKFLKGLFEGPATNEGLEDVGHEDTHQIADLKKEFGICPELARSAEAVFEGIDKHGAAIEFIPAFAQALHDGADITPAKLREFWKRLDVDKYTIEDILRVGSPQEGVSDAFLDFLKAQQPKEAVAA